MTFLIPLLLASAVLLLLPCRPRDKTKPPPEEEEQI